MKKHKGLWILLALLAFFALGCRGIWKATAEYPALGEAVDYPVNRVEGVELTIDGHSFSPFKGHRLSWNLRADEAVGESYTFHDGEVWLEAERDGLWYRLQPSRENVLPHLDFALGKGDDGGLTTGVGGWLIQKYDNYGTRLEPGRYRLVVRLTDSERSTHYLAAEFSAD